MINYLAVLQRLSDQYGGKRGLDRARRGDLLALVPFVPSAFWEAMHESKVVGCCFCAQPHCDYEVADAEWIIDNLEGMAPADEVKAFGCLPFAQSLQGGDPLFLRWANGKCAVLEIYHEYYCHPRTELAPDTYAIICDDIEMLPEVAKNC